MWYLFAFILNILNAIHDGNRIIRNKKVFHFWNSFIAFAFVGISYLVTKNWQQCIGLLAFRKITFDIALNIKRGKNPFYVSETTSSIVDKISLKIFFGNPYVMYGFYLLIIISTFIKR